MDPVYQRLVHDLDAVTASITALHDPGRRPPSPVATLRGRSDAALSSDVELTPKDIEVSAAVDARFVVDRS
jgi:hypothetical protein